MRRPSTVADRLAAVRASAARLLGGPTGRGRGHRIGHPGVDQGRVGVRPRGRHRAGPAAPGRPDRLRQPLPRPAADLRAGRGRHRGGAEQRRTAPSTSTPWPCCSDPVRRRRGAGGAGGAHPHRDPPGPGQPGGGGRGPVPPGRRSPTSSTPARASGQIPVDVGRIGCDVATATGRKWLRGPRGTGLLFVRVRLRRAPATTGHRPQRGRVGGRRPLPLPGRRPAASPSSRSPSPPTWGWAWPSTTPWTSGIDAIARRVGGPGRAAPPPPRGHSTAWPCTTAARRRSGIVTFTVEGAAPAAVAGAASAAGINVSVSEAPWARLDMVAPDPTSMVRASPHYYNTEDELARLVEVVDSLAG